MVLVRRLQYSYRRAIRSFISFNVELHEKYLTWKTGKDKQLRDWEKWREETINIRGSSVKEIFKNFKYVMQADPEKFFDWNEPFGWIPVKDFDTISYPIKSLGENTVWHWVRAIEEDGDYLINEIGGHDLLFLATNDDWDAMQIAMKFI